MPIIGQCVVDVIKIESICDICEMPDLPQRDHLLFNQSVAKGLAVLRAFDAQRRTMNLAEIAEAHDIDKQAIIDATVAGMKAHLDEKVADGDLTQEEADAKLADITERFTTLMERGWPVGGPGQHSDGD